MSDFSNKYKSAVEEMKISPDSYQALQKLIGNSCRSSLRSRCFLAQQDRCF